MAKLEEEADTQPAKQRAKREVNLDQPQLAAFQKSLMETENLIGPNICQNCDREMKISVKIRCYDCTNP